MLMDFSSPAYGKAAAATVTKPDPDTSHAVRPLPSQSDGARPAMTVATTDLLDDPADWDWQQLRAYVMRSIAERHGPQPTGEEIRIASIFKSFAKRWGALAGPIARFAFEQQDGLWRSAPVTATRFTKGNDPYFAQPIVERITHA